MTLVVKERVWGSVWYPWHPPGLFDDPGREVVLVGSGLW